MSAATGRDRPLLSTTRCHEARRTSLRARNSPSASSAWLLEYYLLSQPFCMVGPKMPLRIRPLIQQDVLSGAEQWAEVPHSPIRPVRRALNDFIFYRGPVFGPSLSHYTKERKGSSTCADPLARPEDSNSRRPRFVVPPPPFPPFLSIHGPSCTFPSDKRGCCGRSPS